MTHSFWRIASIAAIATGLYIGHGLHGGGELPVFNPVFASPAYAGGVATMGEDTRYFVTASEDGRTVYVWEFNGAREPQYQAQAVTQR